MGLLTGKNLMNLIGKIPRDNKSWEFYDLVPEVADRAGKAGIKLRTIPDWMSDSARPFVLGNSIMIPKGYIKEVQKIHPYASPEDIMKYIIPEEMPHVAQYREEGLLGFLGKHLGGLLEHGGDLATYDVKGTHESYHHADPSERERLMETFKE
tara:strand:- start:493 stop:951 length:459 start_codon:yes stop_codon:yes gene_type:complete